MSFLKSLIGDKAFYKRAFSLAVPVMVQMGITNFVNLLDNIMVGNVSTEAMSGVSIVNQFIFIFNLLIFGSLSGAGIYTVQFYGNSDVKGMKYSFRFKFLASIIISVLGIVAFVLLDDTLIKTFLFDQNSEGDLALTLKLGKEYLAIMLIGLVPYALSQVYASTLRETEHSLPPMVSSVIAVSTNFVLNYLLIFGKFGFPELGVKGAAIATVISRFVELGMLVGWTHLNTQKCSFIKGVFRSVHIPYDLVRCMMLKGFPLMANEFLWSSSITLRNRCYATRGLEAVAAQNICSTVMNVVSVVYMSFGTVIAIMVGSQLGAGEIEEAKKTNRKLLACTSFCGLLVGILLISFSGLFPMVYKTSQAVRGLAGDMMIVSGILMTFQAFSHASYFSIRSGGNVLLTFFLDCGFMWMCVIPITLVVSEFTNLSLIPLYIVGQGAEIFKLIFAFVIFKRGTWTKRLVGNGETEN
jgi:putative MATE family efflux protein